MNLIIITTTENGIRSAIFKYTFAASEGRINLMDNSVQDSGNQYITQ